MTRRLNGWLFASVLALAVAVVVLIALLSSTAAAQQTDPPDADMCAPGFIVTTIAGSVSCQPEPRVVVTPAPEPTMPPVVIETPGPTAEPAAPTTEPVAPVAPAPEPAPPTCIP